MVYLIVDVYNLFFNDGWKIPENLTVSLCTPVIQVSSNKPLVGRKG